MKKRTLAALSAVLMAGSCVAAPVAFAGETEAASGKTFEVGIVKYVDDASLNQIEASIEKQLDKKSAELGVTFHYTEYDGQADSTTLNQFASKLVDEKVDCIVPIATPAAVIMQSATEDTGIPVVFSAVTDPETAGLVKSNDAPGANVTGTSDALDTEAVFKLMQAANPNLKKVGLLYNKSEDASKKAIEEAKAYCDKNGLEYVEKTGTTADEIIQAAQALIGEGVEAAFTPTDNTVMTAELSIYEDFIDAKIPQYCGADSFALNGAFCGYGVNYAELGTETANMVSDILAGGEDPATTAVRTLNNGIATVNTETAEAIGIDYSMFKDMCEKVVETKTAKEFSDQTEAATEAES